MQTQQTKLSCLFIVVFFDLFGSQSFFESTKAQLQIAASFLPGRIADAHVSQVARHLVGALSLVTQKTGLVGKPTALLTRELGEPGA